MRHGTHTEHVDKNGTPLVVGDKLQSETGQNFSIDRYGRLVDVVGHPVTNAKPADLEFVCHADLSGRKPKASAKPKPEQPKPANKKKPAALSDFTDAELAAELTARGYSGQLSRTNTLTIG